MLGVSTFTVNIDDNHSASQSTQLKQMETRKFTSLYTVEQITEMEGTPEFEKFKAKILPLIGVPREYVPSGLTDEITMDSHIELEKLGIGTYSRKYIHVIDMTYHLDLVLAGVCSAKLENVINIPQYNRYSKALLTGCEKESKGLVMGDIFHSDDCIDEHLISIEEELLTEEDRNNFPEEAQLKVITQLYKDIMHTSKKIREDIIYGLKQIDELSDIVYRSRNHYCSIFTSDHPIDSDIEVIIGGQTKNIKLKTYERFDYARERGAK